MAATATKKRASKRASASKKPNGAPATTGFGDLISAEHADDVLTLKLSTANPRPSKKDSEREKPKGIVTVAGTPGFVKPGTTILDHDLQVSVNCIVKTGAPQATA